MKSDPLLKADVTAELAWDTSIGQPAGIGVAVKGGIVTLSGNVDSLKEREKSPWAPPGAPKA